MLALLKNHHRLYVEVVWGCLALLVMAALIFGHVIERPDYTPFGGAVEVILPGGNGSGVFIDPTHVVTAAHVVADAKDGVVAVQGVVNGNVVSTFARVVQVDPKQDVALLQLEDKKSPFKEYAALACRTPILNEPVQVVGYPLFLGRVVSHGFVAEAEANHIGASAENNYTPVWEKAFLVDANVAPGNSGGPVYDQYGSVLGIAVAVPLVPSAYGMPSPDDELGIVVPASELCDDFSLHIDSAH